MAKKDRDKSTSKQDPQRRSVQHTAELTNEDAAASLEVIARGLREGRLVVHDEEEVLEVAVPSHLEIEVKAKSSRGARRTSLELNLKWKDRKDADSSQDASEAVSEEAIPETVALPASNPPESGWKPGTE